MQAIQTAHLYGPLHEQLVLLLENLTREDWRKPTVCAGWAVRDIAAHLLDVDLRRLSFSRDAHEAPAPDSPISSYPDLVAFLNRLNSDWVRASRRLSPRLLIDLLRLTGPQISQHVTGLDMTAPSRFSVAWAGEDVSANWFDVARDYTERWHHQQQIRDAVGALALTGAYWLSPVLETFMRSLPHHYRDVQAGLGDAVGVSITGEAGGEWTLSRGAHAWQLEKGLAQNPTASIVVDQDTAWRHFTKGISRDEMLRRWQASGDSRLAEHYLSCLAVMA